MKIKLVRTTIFAILISLAASLHAQEGVSSFSVGVMRAGMMPPSSEIRIEEFINYHRHRIPLPEDGQRVRLDLDWAQQNNGKSVIQIGITTPQEFENELMPPLNLVLVIDRSGSMAGDKIDRVQEALLELVNNVRSTDQICIVSFSDEARVDLESCKNSDVETIRSAIRGIEAGGYTNLHSGLMLGYQQARKYFREDGSNRVILLSDGVSNRGVTDSDQIKNESKQYNQRDIDLTTIGLGHDYNAELLRDLADAGRGAAHFVGDSKDIQKTFVAEVKGLLAPAARNIKLIVDFGETHCKPRFFGYKPTQKGTRHVFKLENLSYGSTQVVMAELDSSFDGQISATLKFDDAVSHQAKRLAQQVSLAEDKQVQGTCEVTRNYVIAKIASAIRVAAKNCEDQKFDKAEQQLQSAIRFARKSHLEEDADVKRVIDIARMHRKNIAQK